MCFGKLEFVEKKKKKKKQSGTYNLLSHEFCLFVLRTGKKGFKFPAPSAWNNLKSHMKIKELVSLDASKNILTYLKAEVSGFILCIALLFYIWCFGGWV